MSVPSGWEQFSNYGSTVDNLFLPHKVPLKEYMTRSLPPQQRFTTQDLMDRFPNLGMVVDLTQTANPTRYYNPIDLEENGIKHVKITVRGGGFLPESSQIDEFISIIDDFKRNNPGKLIGVHCTHGLNRTGFMICNFLIRKHGISGKDALQIFEEARGHQLERQAYVDEILSHTSHDSSARQQVSHKSFPFHSFTGDFDDHYRGYPKKDWNVPVEYHQRTRVFYNSGLTESERWEVNRTLRPVLHPHVNYQQRDVNHAGRGNGTGQNTAQNRWDSNQSWASNVSRSIYQNEQFNTYRVQSP